MDGHSLIDEPGLTVLTAGDVSVGLTLLVLLPSSSHSISLSESDEGASRVGFDSDSVEKVTLLVEHEDLTVSTQSDVTALLVTLDVRPSGSHWGLFSDTVSPVGLTRFSESDDVAVEAGVELDEILTLDKSPAK